MITHVALWVLVLELLSWAGFIVLRPLLQAWPDAGLGLSKAAGVLALGLITWLVAWSHAAAPSAGLAWAAAALLALGALGVSRANRGSGHRPALRNLVIVESLWLLTLAAFLAMRAAAPAISGGEKFMDSAMLGASMRATTMPPVDPWFADAGINYYFFGYWSWAQPARMLGIPSSVAYNLAMATVPAQAAAAAYSVGLLIARRPLPALAASLALVWCGTLAALPGIGTVGPAFDIWGPTRVIPGTINEFPFFSFYWGDLHPHVMAMPAFILSAGVCLALCEAHPGRARRGLAAVLGLLVGVAAATSSWDLAPLGLLVAGVLAIRIRQAGPRDAAELALVIVAAGALVALPAALSVHGGEVGFGVSSHHSPWRAFLLVQGGWLLPIAVAAAATVAARSWRWHPAWLLVGVAVSMLVLAEVFYLDDVYGFENERLNTVFKFHLQAMILLALAWSHALSELGRLRLDAAGGPARAWLAAATAAVTVAIAALLVYPAGAVAARWSTASRPLTLDGAGYLERASPGDRALVAFAAAHITGQPVIVEASGNQYEYAGRISANTGLPAVIGWAVHERLWRRDAASRQAIDDRVTAVRELYEGGADAARAVVSRFGVRYVVVGEAERRAYPGLVDSAFATLGRVVFRSGATELYEVTP